MEISKLARAINTLMNGSYDSQFGQNGFQLISDTDVHKGRWEAIKAGGADITFNKLRTIKGDNADLFVLKAGDVIYGPFKEIQIGSGTVLAYYK